MNPIARARVGATVAIALIAVSAICSTGAEAQTSTRRPASAEASPPRPADEAAAPQVERVEPMPDRTPWGYPVIRIGQSYQLRNGEVARVVTVVFGDAYI